MKYFFLIVSLCLLTIHAQAQVTFLPDTIKKKTPYAFTSNKIKIDGRLNEPDWLNTEPVPDFIQMDPSQGAPAKKRTVVKILYNEDYLFISAVCYDTVGKNRFRVPNLKRDFAIGSGDDFSVAIDGYNDERNAVAFATNPYAVQSDLLSFDDNYYDANWDGLWIVKTQRSDTAWVAEMGIPWKSLRYKSKQDSFQTWGISFGRTARAINEISGWPAFPRAYSTLRMAYAAKIENIKAPDPTTNIRVQPYVLYSNTQSKQDGTVVYKKESVKPGGDIKWAVSPNTLLDVTFNTDFAQSDVDRLVNNANRFSVFFPEKRQFFLENAGLFAVGIEPLPNNGFADYSARIQPFFSRRIGLEANGNPIAINAGARLISRTEQRSFGALVANQRGNDRTNPAYFLTGRYSENFGKQNRIGALLTYKAEEDKLDTVSTDRGFTGAIDGFVRFSQLLSLSYMGSITTERNVDHPGFAGSAQAQYNSNKMSVWLNESFNTDRYNPKMGFVGRQNVIITEPGFSYQIRAKWFPKYVRAIFTGMSYIAYHDTRTFELTDRYFSIIPVWCRFQNRTLIFYNAIFTRQRVAADFSLLGEVVAAGEYAYVRQKFGVASDQSKKISASLTFNLGDFYGGKYNALTTTISIAPLPHVFISSTMESGKLEKFGSEQLGTKDVNLYSLECRLSLNPQVQLSGLFQQSSINNTVGWNTRFSWEFTPRSFFYIVFNKNRILQTERIDDQQFITKISYLKQF